MLWRIVHKMPKEKALVKVYARARLINFKRRDYHEKIITVLLVLTTVFLVFTGCGKQTDSKTIKVGASVTPHAEILKLPGIYWLNRDIP